MKQLLVMFVMFVMSLTMVFSGSAMAWSWSSDCEYSREIEREVSMDDVKTLRVKAGAGELDIHGKADRDTVLIRAQLCADDKDTLAEMDVSSNQTGELVAIVTEFVKNKSWGKDYSQARIDLELIVPARLILDVSDSSGEAEVRNVAALIMVDSSGELEIGDIAGNVDVTDSSGALEIENVGGGVLITDSSGGIEVSDVKQDVIVEADSSGGISIESVGGSVNIKHDSSGGIEVDTVGGDFTVGADTSGSISHEKVSGNVSLPN